MTPYTFEHYWFDSKTIASPWNFFIQIVNEYQKEYEPTNSGFILVNAPNDKNNAFFVIFLRICFEVAGLWSAWGAWGKCSVTCGRGTHERHRTCSNPAPSHGGADCVGSTTLTQHCDSVHCPSKNWCPFATSYLAYTASSMCGCNKTNFSLIFSANFYYHMIISNMKLMVPGPNGALGDIVL